MGNEIWVLKKAVKIRINSNIVLRKFSTPGKKKSRLFAETGLTYNSLPFSGKNSFNNPCHPYQVRHVHAGVLLSWVCQLPHIQ